MTTDASGNPAVKDGQQPDGQQQAPAQVQIDPNSLFADQLASIQADDGRQKYADVNTALQSIPHAQNHIKELTDKVAELQEELTKRKGAEDLVASLQQSNSDNGTDQTETLDVTAIQNIVHQALAQNTQQQTAQANVQTVKQQLAEKLGEAAPQEFERKAAELGVSVKQLSELASQAPAVVTALFSGAQAPTGEPTQQGSVQVPATPAKEIPDYMAKFSASGDDTQSKWAKAKEAVANQS